MDNDYIAHFGIKRRSGRYPWGSGERPYQSEGGSPPSGEKAKKDPEKMRRKALIKSSNLHNMTTQDLRDMIDRMKQERELKQLVEEDISPGKRAMKKAASEIGLNTLKKVAQGSLDYGIYLAMTDGEFNTKDLAKAIYPNIGKKKSDDQGRSGN